MMLRASNTELAPKLDAYKMHGYGGGFLSVRAIKRQIDGALGSRGAWLLAPYTDKPDCSGLNTDDPVDIRRTAELAIQHGYQLCVHAIGDRANREMLNIYEETFKAHPNLNSKDLRWRIEHAQHLSAVDIPRFGQLGVIAAMQAIHCTSDAPLRAAAPGRQARGRGRVRVAEAHEIGRHRGQRNGRAGGGRREPSGVCIYAAVSRKPKDGSVFYPDQRMSREEALRSYTWNNAYAAFEEKRKGSLETGKLADITVLSRDIMTMPEDQILATDIVYTIVGGKVMFEPETRSAAIGRTCPRIPLSISLV